MERMQSDELEKKSTMYKLSSGCIRQISNRWHERTEVIWLDI